VELRIGVADSHFAEATLADTGATVLVFEYEDRLLERTELLQDPQSDWHTAERAINLNQVWLKV
jgi:hypothetical protein